MVKYLFNRYCTFTFSMIFFCLPSNLILRERKIVKFPCVNVSTVKHIFNSGHEINIGMLMYVSESLRMCFE